MSHKAALANKSLHLLNTHFSIRNFSEQIGSIFGPIYLYQLGFNLQVIFFVWVLGHLLRFIFRPIIIKLLPKVGLKTFVIIGTLFYAGMYPILSMATEVNIWFYIFIIYLAITDVTYWLPYHIYFTHMSDEEHQGKQVGMRTIFVNILTMFSPVVGGSLIAFQSYSFTFFLAGIFILLSLIPLFFIQNRPIEKMLPAHEGLKKVSFRGAYIYCFNGMLYISFYFTWNIVLFQLLQTTFSMGWILFVAIVFKIILSYFVGHSIDLQKKQHLLIYGALFTAIALIGKVFWGYTIAIIILLDAILMLGGAILETYVDTTVYKTSHQSKQITWFQFIAETGWDVGVSMTCSIIIILLHFNVELRHTMLIGLCALPALVYVLSQKYQRH